MVHPRRPPYKWLPGFWGFLEHKIGLKINKKCVILGTIFWILFWILLITEDENLDSVLFFTALLRREQGLKMCFFGHFELFDHPRRPSHKQVLDSVGHFGAQNWPKNQQKMCYFRDHFLDPFFGSF